MREYLRAVVWPKQQKGDKQSNYRYVIVGVLVTDEPIEGFTENQHLVDSHTRGLAEKLQEMNSTEISEPLGDATTVLLKLRYLGVKHE